MGLIRGPRDAGGDVRGCVGGGGVGEVPLLPLISGKGGKSALLGSEMDQN